jgi:hypothetical protein
LIGGCSVQVRQDIIFKKYKLFEAPRAIFEAPQRHQTKM